MKIRVLEFRQDKGASRATIIVAAEDERISSEVAAKGLGANNVVPTINFNSPRLLELMAIYGFAQELVIDCSAAFGGTARPLPWDYGEFPAVGVWSTKRMKPGRS